MLSHSPLGVVLCFRIVLWALFYAVIRRNSVSLLRFHFLIHVIVFSWEISLVCCLKCPYCCFFLYIFVCWLFFLFSACLYSLLVDVSMHRHYLECRRVLFLLIFLTHTVCLQLIWDVMVPSGTVIVISSMYEEIQSFYETSLTVSLHPTIVLDMTLNNLMIRFQYWSFEECGLPLYYHSSKFHSDPE